MCTNQPWWQGRTRCPVATLRRTAKFPSRLLTPSTHWTWACLLTWRKSERTMFHGVQGQFDASWRQVCTLYSVSRTKGLSSGSYQPWSKQEVSEGGFCYKVTFIWCGINLFSRRWKQKPGLPGIPPIEHDRDKAWVMVKELFVTGKVIDEVWGAEDAHTHYHTDDSTSHFMSTAVASLTTPLDLTSVEIARREIQVWKSRTIPLPKTINPLKECHRGVKIFPWLSLLARRVLAIPATSTAPERLFSTLGNTMTKKRCSLSCDHLEKCVYLHEACPQV